MTDHLAATRSRVDVPEGRLDGVEVRRFTVKRDSLENIRLSFHGRSTAPGEYTALYVNGRLWMSDTDAEYRDHLDAIWRIRQPETRRVLINGLGLGMVVQAALDCEHVEHVDVVECDRRVIDLVGPHYTRDPRVIWPDLCTDNLPLMAKLHRRYGRRVGWQGSWGKELLRLHRERRSGR